jgi:hypothetical protein
VDPTFVYLSKILNLQVFMDYEIAASPGDPKELTIPDQW